MKKKPIEDYIHYEPMSGCWLWGGTIDKCGYGLYCDRKEGQTRTKQYQAHRETWMKHRGEIPAGMVLDHKCRNRACVNPDHLRVVTPSQNTLENSNSFSARNAAKTHCSGCNRPFSEIRLTNSSVSRGARQCADCVTARVKKWYSENTEYAKAKARERHMKRKNKLNPTVTP